MKTMPINDVLSFLAEHHPSLHAKAEIERAWVWLADTDLQGDQHKATRESLKEAGFQFKHHGIHTMPSGKTSRWSHHCLSPRPFRKGKWRKNSPTDHTQERDMSDEEILAALA